MSAFRKLLFIYISVSLSFSVLAQSTATTDVTPKIISPAPNAASLGKYGQIPIGLSNGIPEISIPIYTIKTTKLSLPISLSYHSGGVKVDEVASMCGLSWSLQAGGVITRSVVGLQDEGGYLLSKPPLESEVGTNTVYLEGVTFLRNIDTEPDLYFFNFNGKSGKFVFGEDNKPIIIPNQNIDIQYLGSNFRVIDDQGTIYWFEEKESVASGVIGGATEQITTNSWYLTKIISHDKSDTIKLSYKNDSFETFEYNCLFSEGIGGKIFVPSDGSVPTGHDITHEFPALSGVSYRKYAQKLPDVIQFSNGQVEFTTVNDRIDQGVNRLTAIKVFSTTGVSKLIKETRLQHDYFRSPQSHKVYPLNQNLKNRLKLLRVYDIAPQTGAVVNEYKMEYNETPLPPVGSYAQDEWGFFNGQHANETLLKKQTDIPFVNAVWSVGNAIRETDIEYMQAGILTRLHYPTRGYTEFDFEAHEYEYGPNTVPVSNNATAYGITDPVNLQLVTVPFTVQSDLSLADLRVVEVKFPKYNYPNVTDRPWAKIRKVSTNEYIYTGYANADAALEHSEVREVSLEAGVQYELIAYAQGNSQVSANIEVRYKRNLPGPKINRGGGLRVKQIKNFDGNQNKNIKTFEYSTGQLLSTWKAFDNTSIKKEQYGYHPGAICTEYYSDFEKMAFSSSTTYPLESFSGSPVAYSQVTQYEGDNTASNNNGKTVYQFNVIPNTYIPTPPRHLLGGHPVSNSWENGIMTRETQYRYDPSDTQYKPVQETSYVYRKITGNSGRGQIAGHNFFISGCHNTDEILQYYWFDYPIPSGRYVLDSLITRSYLDTKILKQSTAYLYENIIHYLPTQELTFESNGDLIKTTNKYPHDFIPGAVYDEMIARNIVTPVIEKVQRNETRGLELSRIKTDYEFWENNIFIDPKSMKQSIGGAPLETETTMDVRDNKSNVLQYTSRNGIVASFIWGYGQSYPLAEIMNASQSDIAFTSFESIDNGNWTLNTSASDASDAITGKKCYDLSSGSISKSLLSSKSYFVSCWIKSNSSLSINGIAQTIPAPTIRDWSYVEKLITNSSTVTISGSGKIDELRLYPPGGQMTTFTYDPMIGVTSTTDKSNTTVHYVYDELGRLKLVRDHLNNIVKQYEYNYQIK